MKKLLMVLGFLMCMTSCLMEQGFTHHWNQFTVDQGDHKFKEDKAGLIYIQPFLKFEGSSRFWAKFEQSCFYDKALLGSDSMDINKLYGLSDCFAHHQRHSVRIGWRPIDAEIMELFAYVYSNGERIIQSIGTVNQYEEFVVKIDLYGDHYDVWFKDSQFKLPRSKRCGAGTYYRLFPYFGGNKGAPHWMALWLYEED